MEIIPTILELWENQLSKDIKLTSKGGYNEEI